MLNKSVIARDIASLDGRTFGWIAGLLEGEGSFLVQKGCGKNRRQARSIIQIKMTDRDVLQELARLMKVSCLGPYGPYKGQKKKFWVVVVTGTRACVWMEALHSQMSARRQVSIETVLGVDLPNGH